MRILRSAIAALLLCAAAPAAHAQQVNEDEIVVTGRRVQEAIREFVRTLSTPPTGEDQLARWDRRICPGVAGVRARQGQMLIDRLAQRAFEVGLDVGEPGCTPNVLIFVTPEDKAMIRKDQSDCMGCLSQCAFSSWADNEKNSTGRLADPRSFFAAIRLARTLGSTTSKP